VQDLRPLLTWIKKGHQGNVSSYIKNLIFPRQQHMYKEHGGNRLVLDALKLIGISGCDRVPYYRGTFQPGPD
jgi:hypothetical protein